MIKYFQVKKRSGKRANEIYYREKANSRSNDSIVEKYISTKKPLLILGDGDSGKTRSMMKFYDSSPDIWRRKPPPILLSGVNPLMQWIEQDAVIDYAESISIAWKGLKQYQKVQLLIDYCENQSPVVFVDDLHRLTGRKLQIAKACMRDNVFIATAITHNRLPPTVRDMVVRRKPQTFTMSTNVAYDATTAFAWFFVVIFIVAGLTEMAILAGGFNLLANGRRGSSNAG